MHRTAAVLFLMTLLLTGCSSETDSGKAPGKKESQTALSFPVISHGKKVTLSEHTADGKFTVFKFTADW